jgi:transposase InsO family protein
MLGELGDDPQRFADARALRSFAGTAPIIRASGPSRMVSARRICNRRLGDTCHWWAFAAQTKSDDARAHYDQRRALGDTHNAALRNLANKLLATLWHCPQTSTPDNETSAWPVFQSAAAWQLTRVGCVYVLTWQGFAYLATVLDCCTKECVGHAIVDHMRAELVIDALRMAARNYDLEPKVIFHTDRVRSISAMRAPRWPPSFMCVILWDE